VANLSHRYPSRKPELTGVPLYDAEVALISLAAASTVADINSIQDIGLALQISALISENIEPEAALMDLRARVLQNRAHLAHAWREQQESSRLALQSTAESRRCPHCGGILEGAE
jgi:hypothetical protein